ncbi:2-oxoglutarate and iron-dependent oxygenase domain-containing protein [Alkalimonas collagenimarina]|uniref:2-oxoglutarate-dependent ethylene/succinate-forming enzyme n=1 Tax=Alkalimonas collagenimarina TaxID=400390 RepID=A0ABT9GWY3_9GAMM|nr:2-oxoglutarate and iron-dependent oxygenase domain-containing protein [Alkalimonas collagenimarina]MDP4535559.1 2-oxoglutarate and iron-dependent oxygenase domain-containing protein [Alkalimonas collagenimarina]
MTQQVPTLDIRRFATDKDNFVAEIGKAYTEFGFCGISGHGISDAVVDDTYSAIKQFFALPSDVKARYYQPGQGGARGYTAVGVEKAKDSNHPDLKEFWHVGRELDGPAPHPSLYPNVWPTEVPEFKEATYRLFMELENLGNRVLEALALFLDQPQDYFADKVNFGNSILRPIHYPPIKDTTTQSIRAGQHEDINLITLLVGSNEAGLEILRRDGSWLPVTTIEGTIVVNIGDMLQRLTNHVLPSTTHRVVNPAGSAADEPRYSIPFFMHPNPDFVIETLPSCISADRPNRYPEPINSNDYLLQRLEEIGLLKKSEK